LEFDQMRVTHGNAQYSIDLGIGAKSMIGSVTSQGRRISGQFGTGRDRKRMAQLGDALGRYGGTFPATGVYVMIVPAPANTLSQIFLGSNSPVAATSTIFRATKSVAGLGRVVQVERIADEAKAGMCRSDAPRMTVKLRNGMVVLP
jgi:hypothetical protein